MPAARHGLSRSTVRAIRDEAGALGAASVAAFSEPERVAFTLLAALAGVSRGSFGKRASDPAALDRLRDEARLLSRGYLWAAANSYG